MAESDLIEKKFEILEFQADESSRREQEPYQDTLKRSFIRGCFWKSKGTRFSQSQNFYFKLRVERSDGVIRELNRDAFSSCGNLP